MSNTTEDNPKCFIPYDDIEESLNERKYCLILDNEDDKLHIWGGYWKVEAQSLKLRAWEPNFKPEEQKSTSAFFWVQFPGLSMEYWKEKIILNMGNYLGRSIKVDETTLKREIGYYASVLVEMDMPKFIPNKIWGESKYGSFEQTVVGHSVTECRSKKKVSNQVETEPVVQAKKTLKKVNPKNKNHVGFDICFNEEEIAQNTQHTHILDCEDEIINAIVPPISQGGGGENSSGSSLNSNEGEVSSGKFQILQNMSEEILNSPSAFPVLSATKISEVASSAPSINEVIIVIPPLGKSGSNVENNQVKQKHGTNVTTRKHAASLVSNISKNGNMRREPKIRYSSAFIKKLKLSGMHYEVKHNSTDENKGNIWILWSASIKSPTIISCTRQEITVAVGETLITGVHVASLTVDRRELWKDMEVINSLNKPWLVIGDFNVVTCLYEKVGGLKPLRISMLEFNNYLNGCGLIQSPKTGLDFSWCNNRAGRKRIISNLDMAVFNDKWLELYPSWGYKVGVRGISDHGVLYGASADIPKPKNVPFRALKVWKNHPSFKQVIIDSWNSAILGNPGFIFTSKLKRLKKDIQLWNWNSFGDVTKKLKQAEEDVLKDSLLFDRNPLDLHPLNNLIRQAQNTIVKLEKQEGGITYNQEEIADILVKHFEDKFTYQEVNFATNIFNDIPIVANEDDNFLLEVTPKAEEIREAIFELNPDSVTGPDGFAGWFYREVWEIIGEDFINVIQFWWSRGFIPNGLNANFLLLLPKVKNAKRANQFRPIGLMNFSFKVITKIITKRLTEIIKKVVSPQHGAFIKGRNIQEKIALASELVNDMENKRRGGNMGLELDISQAYDSLSLGILVSSHEKMISFILCNVDKRNVRKLLKVLKDYQAASSQLIILE
ncbi:uncharacterized protein LOC113315585 [Papaver somniferum]|uniref:uncharacterized protein LOC113315585 n=1 Tax=Papaver somniferum TaxID=3469 RepID=UPI000E70564C|nr:uncharacterized protein LOC113315585 [Papaver somniferum]